MPADPPAAVPEATARTPDPDVTTRRGDSLPPIDITSSAGGRYVLGAEIARGGMGAVYRATDTALGREVAVKLLQERFGPDSGTARRFADEAHIAGQLQHPGIPPVHDFGTLPDGRPFLAMKLIKGDTLDELLRARRDPGDDHGRFVAVFEAVCQAVGYAHAHDVIHRDLKPANVMVGKFGEVQVMDWGLAKVLRPGGAADGTVSDAAATAPNTEVRSLRDSDADHTQAGAVMGTPAYMPPEQAAGAAHKVTPRSDVFGLGAVLAVILTGRPPFEAGSAETVRVKAALGDVADCLSRLDASGAEPELVALCKRCLSPRPADRPATAGEVAAAVADFRAQAEARARQAELDRVKAEGERATAEAKAVAEAHTRREAEARAAEQRKRRRVQAVLAAALVLLVAGAGGVAVWRVTEAARVEGEEQDRATRAMVAVGALLDQARTALGAGDAARAAPLLDQAEQRSADGRTEEDATRLTAYRRDLAMLRALDKVNDDRWSLGEREQLPSFRQIAGWWAAAFAEYGFAPGVTPPAEFAARISASPIRAALLAALHGWVGCWYPFDRNNPVRVVLDAADPDPFRREARAALAVSDDGLLEPLADRPEWGDQPAWLAVAYAQSGVPAAIARRVLARFAHRPEPDFGVAVRLALTYPTHTRDGAGERVRWLQTAVALRPGNATARGNLGVALMDVGDFVGATATHREAVRLAPGLVLARNNLGHALRATGDLPGAEAAHREAIRLAPADPAGHSGLGAALRVKGDLDAAVAAHREAIRLDPGYAEAHDNLGIALRAAGDLAGAEAAYREAVRLKPAAPQYHYHLGQLHDQSRNPAGAAAAYREAVRLAPWDAKAQTNLGVVLYQAGDAAGAELAFAAAALADPADPFPPNGLGVVRQARGDAAGAAAAFRVSVRLDPANPDALNNLGVALKIAADFDGAAAAYRRAVELDPKRWATLSDLGYVLRVRGQHADAVAAFRAALAIQPRDTYAREGLDYCERVLRGEVPTAPPPRAVAR